MAINLKYAAKLFYLFIASLLIVFDLLLRTNGKQTIQELNEEEARGKNLDMTSWKKKSSSTSVAIVVSRFTLAAASIFLGVLVHLPREQDKDDVSYFTWGEHEQ